MAMIFRGETIKGTVMQHAIPPRTLQNKRTQFFGVNGVSRIFGGFGSRPLQIPVLLHDPSFDTAQKLADYVENWLNEFNRGFADVLVIDTLAGRRQYDETALDGVTIQPPGIITDTAQSFGTGYIAQVLFEFTQLR